MISKIDKIITLDDNTKYMILDQGNYNGKCYFLTSKLDAAENLTEEFIILEENNNNISTVKDDILLKSLVKYFSNRTN